MKTVRYGIIGVGNMGRAHAISLLGEIKNAELAAVCDTSKERLEWAEENLPADVRRYSSPEELIKAKTVDAVLIATPHYDHPTLAIDALNAGYHVLIEKPAGVYTKAVQEMNDTAAAHPELKFGIMYNQRTNPLYQKLRELIQSGELGEIRRTNWIITNWYRTQHYYNSGGWRATWGGEGGGVLLNQDPHQLDLWQWITGMMPKRVRAFCHFGKYRDIEVEDDVTAFVEYENSATGLFITTTGEAPGTNRFEINGDNGKIVVENGTLTFWRLRTPEPKFNAEFAGGFGTPECWKCEIPVKPGGGDQHKGILQNFTNAILHNEPLLAPGEEGILGLTLSNAMYLSSWTDNWVELPIDADLFHEKLMEKIKNSTFQKIAAPDKAFEVSGSH
ncbi:Gfo/Idh/MocA family oxidoreductase [Paenibacillus sp. RC67]|uniref:Gfo/Idh/MocA family protein n=1 Tax=Paenibacillus sp. RC67 TaxID=3039392 RepID=UPI0024ACE728|nr:Gfo/Idh/MocA family oxidoreductase [Paenibacillus sp. RC67]